VTSFCLCNTSSRMHSRATSLLIPGEVNTCGNGWLISDYSRTASVDQPPATAGGSDLPLI
jgi:hypothetical protein